MRGEVACDLAAIVYCVQARDHRIGIIHRQKIRSECKISLRECDLIIAGHYAGIADLTGCAEIPRYWKLNCFETAILISDEASYASACVLVEACDLSSIVDRLGESDSGSG